MGLHLWCYGPRNCNAIDPRGSNLPSWGAKSQRRMHMRIKWLYVFLQAHANMQPLSFLRQSHFQALC